MRVSAAIPGGRPPGTQGHLSNQLWQMLFKAPKVELEHCDKYPHPQGRAVSQQKAKQISEGFLSCDRQRQDKKYTVLNTRVVRNKHKMKSYNFINKIAFFTTSLVFVILCLCRLYTSLYKLMCRTMF